MYQSKTRNFLVNSNELSYSLKKFTIFYICCSCSCNLQHTSHVRCILEKSLVINPIVFKFNLGVGIRLFNIFGVVLEQRCSILQHTAAYCCILAKFAAYHLTLLKLHLNEWYVLDDNDSAFSMSKYWTFKSWCSCSCSLQHTYHFCCILEISLVIDPIVFKFNLGVGIRLFNIFGVVLEQRCSILQHTAAYCCILTKFAAYHLTLLKLHLNEWYVLDENNLAYSLSKY